MCHLRVVVERLDELNVWNRGGWRSSRANAEAVAMSRSEHDAERDIKLIADLVRR